MQEHIPLILILSPLVKFFCNPARKWNKKNKTYGRLLSYFVLAFLILYKLIQKEKNCFQLLNVTPFTPFDVIRKSFKTVAFNLHPDRNKDEDAASKYANLVEKYKHISTPESTYKYTRFYDLLQPQMRSINEMEIIDLITLAMFKSCITIATTVFFLFLNDEKVIWHPLLFYQVFMFFFDLYLRLSDELLFTTKIPFIKYYVTFEIIQLFHQFKTFFMHYYILFPEHSKIATSIGANLLINNLELIDKLEALSHKITRVSGPISDDQKVESERVVPDKNLVEVNKTIKKRYLEDYFLKWSNDAKVKYKKLGKLGDKLTIDGGFNLFSFLLTATIIFMTFLNK